MSKRPELNMVELREILRAVMPYALSRCEDIAEIAESDKATDYDRELSAKANAAYDRAEKALGWIE